MWGPGVCGGQVCGGQVCVGARCVGARLWGALTEGTCVGSSGQRRAQASFPKGQRWTDLVAAARKGDACIRQMKDIL